MNTHKLLSIIGLFVILFVFVVEIYIMLFQNVDITFKIYSFDENNTAIIVGTTNQVEVFFNGTKFTTIYGEQNISKLNKDLLKSIISTSY